LSEIHETTQSCSIGLSVHMGRIGRAKMSRMGAGLEFWNCTNRLQERSLLIDDGHRAVRSEMIVQFHRVCMGVSPHKMV
jgi:hypothetical protein